MIAADSGNVKLQAQLPAGDPIPLIEKDGFVQLGHGTDGTTWKLIKGHLDNKYQ